MGDSTMQTRIDKFYQEGQACAENVAPQTKNRSEIAIVVDDLALEIGYLGAKLEELRERLAPIRIVVEGVERLGYASPGYGSELGITLGGLLSDGKRLCAFVDSLLHELAI